MLLARIFFSWILIRGFKDSKILAKRKALLSRLKKTMKLKNKTQKKLQDVIFAKMVCIHVMDIAYARDDDHVVVVLLLMMIMLLYCSHTYEKL